MFETQSRALFDLPGVVDKGLGTLQNVTHLLKITSNTAISGYLLILTPTEIMVKRSFSMYSSLQHKVRRQRLERTPKNVSQ